MGTRDEDRSILYAYFDASGIQNRVLLGMADNFQFFFEIGKRFIVVTYAAGQSIEVETTRVAC